MRRTSLTREAIRLSPFERSGSVRIRQTRQRKNLNKVLIH
jgi:hypothetical protein